MQGGKDSTTTVVSEVDSHFQERPGPRTTSGDFFIMYPTLLQAKSLRQGL